MQTTHIIEHQDPTEASSIALDRKAFVANSCMSLRSCLRLASNDPAAPPAENEFDETLSFIDMINYVATTPVILWDGSETKRLSPEAAPRFLADPDCEITMIELRPEEVQPAEAPP
jgi:hypothetical protein